MNSQNNNQNKPILDSTSSYPKKSKRYWSLGFNRNQQFCYNQEDLSLLEKIKNIYTDFYGEDRNSFFAMKQDKKLYGWWTCDQPTAIEKESTTKQASYTLPNSESKDLKIHPLWDFSHRIAKEISNWQRLRVKNQYNYVMNDPVMLIFHELKTWIQNDLANLPCNQNGLSIIAKRQSLLKNLIHLIPRFGQDKLYLQKIQTSLNQANTFLHACITNKELPQLLSDLVISGKNLESILGTYLHFLLIDEEVSDNYISDNLKNSLHNDIKSPIHTILKASQSLPKKCNDQIALCLPENPLSHLYQFEALNQNTIKINPRIELLNSIHFASLVTIQDKKNYLEALASIQTLTDIRKTLESFNHLQTSIGSYLFAANYLEQANTLAKHYIKLINKSNSLIHKLINTAENIHVLSLNGDLKPNQQYNWFEHNLRSLETKFTKDTTLSTQLNNYCELTTNSMNNYQIKLESLAKSMTSGEASQEITLAMQKLHNKMHYLNNLLPGILDQSSIDISQIKPLTQTKITLNPQLYQTSPTLNKDIDKEHESAPSLPKNIVASSDWKIKINPKNHTPVLNFELLEDNQSIVNLEFTGRISQIKHHHQTNQAIYVINYGDEKNEIGSLELYGSPQFCVSKDKTRHNILKSTGVFADLLISPSQLQEENNICEALPPHFHENLVQAVGNSALHGFLRGASLAISKKTQSSIWKQEAISQFTYMGCLFTFNFIKQFSSDKIFELTQNPLETLLNSIVTATYDTANYAIINLGIGMLSRLSNMLEHYLQDKGWSLLGKTCQYASSLVNYSFFASHVVSQDWSSPSKTLESAGIIGGSITSGVIAEKITEKIGDKLF